MKATPLRDGELAWMFHGGVDPSVSERLLEASETVERIAQSLGKKAGWTGAGLEYHVDDSGTSIAGFAEKGDVTFWVELRRAEAWEKSEPSVEEWVVEAEVAVRCDAVIDCGMHRVAEWPVVVTASPLSATNAMVAATGWLAKLNAKHTLDHWRSIDVMSGHAQPAGADLRRPGHSGSQWTSYNRPSQDAPVPDERLIALWRQVEPRLRGLGDRLSASLAPEQRQQFREYLDANELGLALEMLADWLSEEETPIADADRAEMLELAEAMGNEARVANPLRLCPPAGQVPILSG